MKPIKIKRTITHGHYENISLEAEIEENETVEQADHALRFKIYELIDSDNKRDSLIADSERLPKIVDDLKSAIDGLTERKQKLIDWFDKMGLSHDTLKILKFHFDYETKRNN